MNKLVKAFYKNAYKLAVVASAAAASTGANAVIDVSGAVTAIGEGTAAVGAIGVAILIVWGTKKVYSLISGK